MKKILVLTITLGVFLIGGSLYAASGDLVVNGNLTVSGTVNGTSTNATKFSNQSLFNTTGSVSLSGSTSTLIDITHGMTNNNIDIFISAYLETGGAVAMGGSTASYAARDSKGFLHSALLGGIDVDNNPAIPVPSAGNLKLYLRNNTGSTRTIHYRVTVIGN